MGCIFPRRSQNGTKYYFLGVEKLAITLLTLICVKKLRIFLIKANIFRLLQPEMLEKGWQHCPAAALGGCGGGRGMTVELLFPEIRQISSFKTILFIQRPNSWTKSRQ
jgi:hypothetical protein